LFGNESMKTLPRGAILLALPILFFATASFALLFSVSGLALISASDTPIAASFLGSQIFTSPPPEEGAILGESTVTEEARPIILRQFLESYYSPLAPYSDLILAVSQEYGLDWRLLTAIAGAESTFARNVIDGCNNAWGWGIHSRGTLCFDSWEEGIRTVAQGLREKFLNDGLTTVDEIMARYAPLSLDNGGSWGYAVSYFMGELERADYHE